MGIYKDYVYQPWPYQLPALKKENLQPEHASIPKLVKYYYKMMTTTEIYTKLSKDSIPCPHCTLEMDWDLSCEKVFRFCPSCRYTEVLSI